ncbi:MAG: methyltransferase [Alphaproteobacteria bacterium]|nr:methyltransferase [Alphaproteobacteria bacterium]NCQ88320.1 methyltransferase [Alphaproteobacteria bacterium]NCT05172.1 methyltransferase [Alphaproteobacteria bacterium]
MKQEITVLNKQLRLKQAENGFRTSLDSVMLGAACPIQAGQSLLDMGCGVGSAGLCVLHRVSEISLTGIEIQQSHCDLALENAALNGFDKAATFLCADIRHYKFEPSYHHIICNPPYLDTGAHLRSPHDAKATAMGHVGDMVTRDWVMNAARLLKPDGSLTMIHQAEKIHKILQAMESRFGAIEIIPLWPKAGKNAKRVIIRAIKGRKSGAIMHSGLILHEEDGGYTLEADKILRHGEGLFL